jgi:hypothetical protein
MNIQKLLTVKAHILFRPRQFSMAWWVIPNGFCRTTCCIAGRVAILEGYDPIQLRYLTNQRLRDIPFQSPPEEYIHTPVVEIAMRSLEISAGQAVELFFVSRWPKDLCERMRKENDPSEQAGIAAEAIDRFIAKYADQPEELEVLGPVQPEVDESELVCARTQQ